MRLVREETAADESQLPSGGASGVRAASHRISRAEAIVTKDDPQRMGKERIAANQTRSPAREVR